MKIEINLKTNKINFVKDTKKRNKKKRKNDKNTTMINIIIIK